MSHKIIVPKRKKLKAEISDDLKQYGLTLGNAPQAILHAAVLAESMSTKAVNVINNIVNDKSIDMVSAFNQHRLLHKWFGKVEKKSAVTDVYNRLTSIRKRVHKGLKIRLRPQGDKSANASSSASFLDPKGYTVYPKIFADYSYRLTIPKMASIFIHELMHLWFRDQKIDGDTVYTETKAIKLAKTDPKAARKSAENYERFCLELHSKSLYKEIYP